MPALYSAFIESLAQAYEDDKSSLVWLHLFAFTVALSLSDGISALHDLLWYHVKTHRHRLASRSICEHLMGHGAAFHIQTNSTDINTAIGDCETTCDSLDFLVLEVLPQTITVIGAEIIIFSLFGPHVGLIQVSVVAINTITVLRSTRVQMPTQDAQITAHQEMKRRLEDALRAFVTVLLNGQVRREIDDYTSILQKETGLQLKRLVSSCRYQFSSDIVVAVGSFSATALAILHGLRTGGTFGPVVMFMNYWMLVQEPLKSFTEIPERLFKDLYTVDQLRRLLEIMPTMQYGAATLQPTGGGIRLKDVSFRYPGANGKTKLIFKRLTLSIAPGETVAFVGPTGAGKSTIFNLITRVFDPDEGSVEIDGQDIRTLRNGA
ncbi:hypothetical protein FSOLCH5_015356 [Fusarium solani]